MTYQSYIARIGYEGVDGSLVGPVADLNGIIGLHDDDVDELGNTFHETVDDYIAACARIAKTPSKSTGTPPPI